MPDLPKGFYTDAEGNQRFWDGEQWFDAAPATKPAKGKSPIAGLVEKIKSMDKKKKLIALASIVVVIGLIGGGVGYSNYAAAEKIRLEKVVADKAAADAAAAQAAADAAAQAATAQQVANRRDIVSQVEASVKKMAKKHVSQGLISGPIKSVSCVPSDGSNVEDLSVSVTKFECFAVYKKHGDGTSDGYYYNATVNWNEGTWTYGYGRG